MFTVTIVLMWAEVSGPQLAMIIGASILAIRRLSEMILAPLSGQISDRLGSGLPLAVMLVLCAAGFCLVGSGALLIGCVMLVLCRGALGTLFPAAAAKLFPGAADILTDEKPDLAGYRGSNRTIFYRGAVSRLQP